jgi:hypothetical protein
MTTASTAGATQTTGASERLAGGLARHHLTASLAKMDTAAAAASTSTATLAAGPDNVIAYPKVARP